MAHEVARRPQLVEIMHEGGSRTFAVGGDGAGHLGDGAAVARDGFQQLYDARLALALEDAIDGTLPVLQDGRPGERGAVPSDADKGAWQRKPGRLCQIDDLGHVGEVVAGEGDKIGLPLRDHAMIIGVALDLQVDETHLMPRAPRSLRHQLKPQRLEPQEDIGIEQRARMNEKSFHRRAAPQVGIGSGYVMAPVWAMVEPQRGEVRHQA